MKDLVLLKKCKRKYSGKKMRSENQKKLGLWLASRQWLPHEFGTNDCCTLLMHYHDHMFDTNTVDEIYGKYNDMKSGIRVASKFLTVDEWFPKHGYQREFNPQTGDIVMVQNNRFFPSTYIICMSQAWSIMDGAKKMSKHIIEQPDAEYSIWRHESWA